MLHTAAGRHRAPPGAARALHAALLAVIWCASLCCALLGCAVLLCSAVLCWCVSAPQVMKQQAGITTTLNTTKICTANTTLSVNNINTDLLCCNLQVREQQTVSIAKAGITTTLNTRIKCAVLCCAGLCLHRRSWSSRQSASPRPASPPRSTRAPPSSQQQTPHTAAGTAAAARATTSTCRPHC